MSLFLVCVPFHVTCLPWATLSVNSDRQIDSQTTTTKKKTNKQRKVRRTGRQTGQAVLSLPNVTASPRATSRNTHLICMATAFNFFCKQF